ncbi:hypothetical protein [Streptomyces sp. RKAG293]|uniref:hypothetical protein n=1 Tax=Streptomyces sp. RKAG293 TaxID=2893403 RepID=UPI0020339CC7|nr:hypothetical protein [Streptomyces sp. RKAG293]MCM2418957.1 hypothetical protein [Streptomyces sp. RKAG293]
MESVLKPCELELEIEFLEQLDAPADDGPGPFRMGVNNLFMSVENAFGAAEKSTMNPQFGAAQSAVASGRFLVNAGADFFNSAQANFFPPAPMGMQPGMMPPGMMPPGMMGGGMMRPGMGMPMG